MYPGWTDVDPVEAALLPHLKSLLMKETTTRELAVELGLSQSKVSRRSRKLLAEIRKDIGPQFLN